MFFFSFLRKTFFLPAVVAFAINLFCYQKLLLPRRLLLRDGGPARPLAGARVGVGSLSTNRQSATMTQAAISADVHQALDIHLDALAQVAFDFALGFQDGTNSAEIVLCQISNPGIDIDICFLENRRRTGSANSVDVSKTDLCALVGRKIYTCVTSHNFLFRIWTSEPELPIQNTAPILLLLSLFMFRICANHSHYTLAMNYFALITDFSN